MDGGNVGTEVARSLQPRPRFPHSHQWHPPPLTAVARDTADNTATSDEVSITVDNRPPQNVVVILSDDQRADLMQYMPLTSNLLNAETVRFASGFVTTSLRLSRADPAYPDWLRFAHNHGVLTNMPPNGGATRSSIRRRQSQPGCSKPAAVPEPHREKNT